MRKDDDSKFFRITFIDLIKAIRQKKSLADGVCRRAYATPSDILELEGNSFVLILFAGTSEPRGRKKGHEKRTFKLLIVNAGNESVDITSSWRERLLKDLPRGMKTMGIVDVHYAHISGVANSDASNGGI